jgi:hypothetical protein
MNQGRRFLICEIRALNHADILRLEKRLTVLFCAIIGASHPDQLQLAGPLSEKSQKILFLVTQNSCLGDTFFSRSETQKKKGEKSLSFECGF